MLSWLVKLGGTSSAPTTVESPSESPVSSTNPPERKLEEEMTVTIKDGLMEGRGLVDKLIEGDSLSIEKGVVSSVPLKVSDAEPV